MIRRRKESGNELNPKGKQDREMKLKKNSLYHFIYSITQLGMVTLQENTKNTICRGILKLMQGSH
ncbi:hypothetical protein BWI96_11065 [Siphonobacter sp. SORGH_AS_0500]|nr:hypothetical protein BWI96_11065 [Siphonobacter sp. SORGH_AS_0500]